MDLQKLAPTVLTLAQEAQSQRQQTKQAQAPLALIDPSHAKQAAFVADEARFIGAICTRRAGKSNGLAYRFFRTALKHPNTMQPYIALTRKSAYNIMWPIFRKVAEKHKIACTFSKSDLTVTVESTKSEIQLFGADQENYIDRLRGGAYPGGAVDEAQSFREHIRELVDDVLTPAMLDYEDSWLALTGTPGPICQGLFYEVTTGQQGYSLHEWSWADNPYLKNARTFVEELKKRRGWTEDHPTFQREWMGKWVQDLDALVYKFTRKRNVTQAVPVGAGTAWHYVLGVDLGYSPDPTAFVLCKYSLTHPKLYVVEAYKKHELTISDVAEHVKQFMERAPYCKVVMDLGGQGKQIGAEITKRHGIPVIAAEKTDKAGFIELMNSDFIHGNIQILESLADDFHKEYGALVWDSAKAKRQEDDRFENHLADSLLYAWRYCHQYAWEIEKKPPSPDSQEYMDDWEERESERIFQRQDQAYWERDEYS